MITSECKVHRIEIDDKSGVVELIAKVLDDPNFGGFDVRISQDWPVGAEKPTRYFNVRVDLEFKKCNP